MTEHSSDEQRVVEELRNKLALVIEERDCAMEMWQLTKQVAERAQSAIPFDIRREMEEVKMEYSEAIKLLESKCSSLEAIAQASNKENQLLATKVSDLTNKVRELERQNENKELALKVAEKEKESLKTSLDQTKEMLKVAEQVSMQARDKVADALSMAQDALTNEASIAEEKMQLEEEIANQIASYEARISQEVEKVRMELESRVENLSTQLHTVTLEKNRFSHEVETLKAECRVVEKQLSMTNGKLLRQLDDLRSQRMNESAMWYEERDSLRRQVTVLQSEVESLLAQVKKAQAACPDCEDCRSQMERYKKLAKRWEDAADRVTTDFEKYLQDSKEHYWQGSQDEPSQHARGEPV